MGLNKNIAYMELTNVSVDIPVLDHSGQRLMESIRRKIRSSGSKQQTTSIPALSDISLSLPSGTRLGIIGANGAGKTTLLRLLSGVYRPSAGQFTTSGSVTSFLDMTFGIEPDLTGREAVMLRSRLLGNSRQFVLERIEEITEFSELGSFIDRPTRTYSSGMFLRLAFSISTILRPEILLMDEWLSVGDQQFRKKAEKKLQEIVAETSLLVLASHSRELIEKSCDRAILLRQGKVVDEGSALEVCRAHFDG